jgi:hypothetical protein
MKSFRQILLILHLFSVANVAGVTSHPAGATLLEVKKSFRNVGNVLYDWSGTAASDIVPWPPNDV